MDRELLLQKLSAPNLSGKIKGVYDLLVPIEDQAQYSGRGRGKHDAVPSEVLGAMREFFRQKLGRDESAKIIEAINDKGSQARFKLKRKGKVLQGKEIKRIRTLKSDDENEARHNSRGSDHDHDSGSESDHVRDSDSGDESGIED